jgi:peptidoglycan/LPS O-acetylase OafA/YrhL
VTLCSIHRALKRYGDGEGFLLVASAPLKTLTDTRNRIAYIDGLRGIAVGLVVLYHVWEEHSLATYHDRVPRSILGFVASQGFQGVSLFLVLSGFCLSLPFIRRYQSGVAEWFTPSTFFARRALRILPPYYAALALCVVGSKLTAHFRGPDIFGAPPSASNLLSHIALVHNLTPYSEAINPPFWSLGLEWQWYWLFPFVLLLCTHSPSLALKASLGVAVVWILILQGALSGFFYGTWSNSMPSGWGIGVAHAWRDWLPLRLFEFTCGVVAAHAVVSDWAPRTHWLIMATILPLAAVQFPPTQAALSWLSLTQPVYGLAFGSLVLLGWRSSIVSTSLSWRPLVALGVMSYSVYLIHAPLVFATWGFAPTVLRTSILLAPIAVVLSVIAGFVFHVTVERPCMQQATWQRLGLHITRPFEWMDARWRRLAVARGRTDTKTSEVHPGATAL